MPPETGQALPCAESPKRAVSPLAFLLIALVVVVVVGVGWYFFFGPIKGSVVLLVRSADGETKSYQTLSLASGSLSPVPAARVEALAIVDVRNFVTRDGSSITLGPAGVVKLQGGKGGASGVLVASPVAPTARTPLAAWNDGQKVAWVSPVDNSLQVFERDERGAYLPVYLSKEVLVNSLGFTGNGSILVAAKIVADVTEIYAIRLEDGTMLKITPVEGLASVIPIP
ncbi:MAG: hypothetical protein AAB923_02035 [Patescibacteria group bacterium]